MSKLLYIKCSPLQKTPRGSISTEAANILLKRYVEQHPSDEIITMDLNEEEAGIVTLTSKNVPQFWSDGITKKHTDLLKSVDRLLIATPMINFNFPMVLKNYIERICAAGVTFEFTSEGKLIGHLKNLTVQIVATQGADFGWYDWGNHAQTLKLIFEFLGAKVLEPVTIYGTNTPNMITKKALEIVEINKSKILDAKF